MFKSTLLIARFLHIVLALLLLLSSTGLLLDKHYCQNQLKDIVVYGNAKACHTDQRMVHCPVHGEMAVPVGEEEKGCCDDATEFVKTDQEQSFEWSDLSLQPVSSPAVFTPAAKLWELIVCQQQTAGYLHYKPPLLTGDFTIELQVFLC